MTFTQRILTDLSRYQLEMPTNEIQDIERVLNIFQSVDMCDGIYELYTITNKLFVDIYRKRFTLYEKLYVYMASLCLVQKFYLDFPYNSESFSHIANLNITTFNRIESRILKYYEFHLPIPILYQEPKEHITIDIFEDNTAY